MSFPTVYERKRNFKSGGAASPPLSSSCGCNMGPSFSTSSTGVAHYQFFMSLQEMFKKEIDFLDEVTTIDPDDAYINHLKKVGLHVVTKLRTGTLTLTARDVDEIIEDETSNGWNTSSFSISETPA